MQSEQLFKRFPDLKVGSQALENTLPVRVFDLAVMCPGDVICGKSELNYMQSRKIEISGSIL